MKFIPLKAQAGIVGFESPAVEYVELELSLDELLIEHKSATFIGFAQGESMMGDGIFDGDLLIVSRAEEVSHMTVIVASFNGEFICKRLDKHHRQLLSSAENATPHVLGEDDDFRVEGVVIRSIRLHKKITRLL